MVLVSCNHCNIKFVSNALLQNHKNKYKYKCNEFKFICLRCDYRTNKSHNMDTHNNSDKHFENHFICKKCNKQFNTLSDYKRHINKLVPCDKNIVKINKVVNANNNINELNVGRDQTNIGRDQNNNTNNVLVQSDSKKYREIKPYNYIHDMRYYLLNMKESRVSKLLDVDSIEAFNTNLITILKSDTILMEIYDIKILQDEHINDIESYKTKTERLSLLMRTHDMFKLISPSISIYTNTMPPEHNVWFNIEYDKDTNNKYSEESLKQYSIGNKIHVDKYIYDIIKQAIKKVYFDIEDSSFWSFCKLDKDILYKIDNNTLCNFSAKVFVDLLCSKPSLDEIIYGNFNNLLLEDLEFIPDWNNIRTIIDELFTNFFYKEYKKRKY